MVRTNRVIDTNPILPDFSPYSIRFLAQLCFNTLKHINKIIYCIKTLALINRFTQFWLQHIKTLINYEINRNTKLITTVA